MIKNKRGEEEESLTANTAGTVLAITATLIIVAFVYIAITQIVRDNELESAKSLADVMKAKIDLIEPGQSGKITFQGNKDLGKNWHLLGWSKNDASKPDKCFLLKSCFCICKGKTADDCKTKGICREFDSENLNLSYFTYKDPTSIQTGPKYDIQTRETDAVINIEFAIPIPVNLFLLEITKSQNNISISSYSQKYLDHIAVVNRPDPQLESAKTILNSIQEELSTLRASDKSTLSELLFNKIQTEETWTLIGWKKSAIDKPEQCGQNSCLCVCKTNPLTGNEQTQSAFRGNAASDCKTKGACIQVDEDLSVSQTTTIPSQNGPSTTLLFPFIQLQGDGSSDKLILNYKIEGEKKSISISKLLK